MAKYLSYNAEQGQKTKYSSKKWEKCKCIDHISLFCEEYAIKMQMYFYFVIKKVFTCQFL